MKEKDQYLLKGKDICKHCFGVFLLVLFLGSENRLSAQSQVEIGLGGGISGYSGELSRSFLLSPGYNVSAFYRTNIDERFSLTFEGDYGMARGGATALGLKFPSEVGGFITNYWGVDMLLGINFFPYPLDPAILNSKNWTPYYFWGVGVKKYHSTAFTAPFGVGIKWKMNDNWALQFQFKAEKLFADDFDGSKFDNPFGMSGFNLHRQDWLYMPTLMITYRIKDKNCNCGPVKERNSTFRKKEQVNVDKRKSR